MQMSPEDRAEFDEAVAECLELPGAALTTREKSDRLSAVIDDAEQAHRQWATIARETWERSGRDNWVRGYLQSQSRRPVALVDAAGNVTPVDASLRRGVQRTDDTGRTGYQQVLYASMTWDELRSVIQDAERRRSGETRTIRIGRRLLDLETPNAQTPQGACDLLGTTVEEYLGAETAA